MPKLNSTGRCHYNEYSDATHYISYSTTIAVEPHGSDIAWYDPRYFSSTTNKHQSVIYQQIRSRDVYNWYGVDSVEHELARPDYGKPLLSPRDWNELVEIRLIGQEKPNTYFKLKSIDDAVELNLFASWTTYLHLKNRASMRSSVRKVWEALEKRFSGVASEVELYPLFRKQSKMKMRTLKYRSQLADAIKACESVKFSVEMREKYITLAEKNDIKLCSTWQNRIRNTATLYDYVMSYNALTLTSPTYRVADILGQDVYDAITSAFNKYQQAVSDDQNYASGEHDVEGKKYFQYSLPEKYHSKKVSTLTGVHKANEIRAYYKSNKGGK